MAILAQRHRLLLLLTALLLSVASARKYGSASDQAEGDPAAAAGYGEEEDDLFAEPFWAEFAGKVQHAVDGGSLMRARRWGNIANGVLLGTTGPVALIISAIGLRLPQALLAGYLTALGGTIAALELDYAPVAPWIQENLSFLYTQPGRTALLAVSGGLAWAFGRTVALAALLTCGNALFNAYFHKILRFISADEEGEFGEAAEEGHIPAGLEEAAEFAAGMAGGLFEEGEGQPGRPTIHAGARPKFQ
jgi:hypothetical protein